jgi:hypothetical protein
LLGLALIAAILIHPVNVGLVIAAIFYILIFKLFASNLATINKTILLCLTLALLLGLYIVSNVSDSHVLLPTSDVLIARFTNFSELGTYFLNLAKLFSGTTVYQYIGGVENTNYGLALDFIIALALPMLLTYLLVIFYKQKETRLFSFTLSLFLTIFAWYFLFSSFSLTPGHERFSLFLIIPITLCVGFIYLRMMEVVRYERLVFVTLIVCNLMIVGLINNYFIPIVETGGESEKTFKINIIEPKEMVFDKVRETMSDEDTLLIATDWWLSQPFMYLAKNIENLEVIDLDASYSPEGINFADEENIFISTFVDDKLDKIVKQQLSDKINNAWAFMTYADEPLVMLYQMKSLELEFVFEVENP